MAASEASGAGVLLWAVFGVGFLAVGICASPRLSGPPWPIDYAAGVDPVWPQRVAHGLWLLGAGVVSALLQAAWARRPRDRFGLLASVALASALAQALHWKAGQPLWAASAIGAAAATLLAPLLRERGVLSLILVSLLVGAVTVVARRPGLEGARAAASFATLRDAVLATGERRCVVVAGEAFGDELRAALAHSLRPPFVAQAVDLFAAAPGSVEESGLRSTGFPGVRIDEGRVHRLPALPPIEQPFLEGVQFVWRDGHGPAAVVPAAEGSYLLRVVTPLKTLSWQGAQPAHGLQLADAEAKALRQVCAELRLTTVAVRVERLPEGPPSPWHLLEVGQ
jgi:hypothetical protein